MEHTMPAHGVGAIAVTASTAASAMADDEYNTSLLAINSTEVPDTNESITTHVYPLLIVLSGWSLIARLVFMFITTLLGMIMNIFFITSIFIVPILRKHSYLSCAGVADLLITSVVMPIATIVLMAGDSNSEFVCQILQTITQMSATSYNLIFLFLAIEGYLKACSSEDQYPGLKSLRIENVVTVIFIFSFALSFIGVRFELDYDYCTRKHFGYFNFRIISALLFNLIPVVLTITLLIRTGNAMRVHLTVPARFQREFDCDYKITYINLLSYIIFIGAWSPYIIILYFYPDTDDKTFYYYSWIGIMRSIINSIIYGALNASFRRAYAKQFLYCFCKKKTTMPYTARNRRHIRRQEEAAGEANVNVVNEIVQAERSQALRDNHSMEL